MSSDKQLYKFYVNDNEANKRDYKFKDNKVDTTKYNVVTFLPKALFIQFMRPANIYFLVCAIIQCIPIISPLGPETAQINPTTESELSKEITKKLYQFNINDNLKNENEYHFKDNKVDTTKYNCITFLPKSLLYQFMRLANVYFLVCAIIQCIPAISPLGPATAIVPLVIVLSVSLIREGYKDCKRVNLDKEQN